MPSFLFPELVLQLRIAFFLIVFMIVKRQFTIDISCISVQKSCESGMGSKYSHISYSTRHDCRICDRHFASGNVGNRKDVQEASSS